MDMDSNEILKFKIKEFNKTEAPYSFNKTIIEFFEEQVELNPNSPAIMFKDDVVTYKELNENANRIAHLLREKGVTRNIIVGIMVERSIEMIAGIFGVLKSGGAYLPIDPNHPYRRIKDIIDDSSIKYMLVNGSTDEYNGVEIIDLNGKVIKIQPSDNLKKMNEPDDLVYVIYTSGTTGKPKGVQISHHSLVNRIEWMQKKYPVDLKDVFIQKTVYTFDVSVWEIFWWFMNGASLFLLEPNKEHDPRSFCKAIISNRVSVIHFVPSVLQLFLDYIEVKKNQKLLSSLRLVFTSGERLDANLAKRFYDVFDNVKDIRLINLYGPTEATIDVTCFDCIKNENYNEVPIGKPIDNTKIYIVDDNNILVPIGEPGELCIAGVGLSKGYLNRVDLTNEKFITLFNETVYKTGDIAKYCDDGNIIFIGRKDNQIKLRGLRIELEEIEHYILKHDCVNQAIVQVKNQYLCAYIVINNPVSAADLKVYLSEFTPDYMIPSVFITLEKMPIKPNGKIDRNLLPEPFKAH